MDSYNFINIEIISENEYSDEFEIFNIISNRYTKNNYESPFPLNAEKDYLMKK